MRGLLDTSIFIASEAGRRVNQSAIPDEFAVCVVTVAELRTGVLRARDTQTRARRLATLESIAVLSHLPIDDAAAASWAALRTSLRDAGRAMTVNDLWIASVAHSQDLAVVTQDDDFDVLSELGLIEVIKV